MPRPRTVQFNIRVPPARKRRWAVAAERCGMTLTGYLGFAADTLAAVQSLIPGAGPAPAAEEPEPPPSPVKSPAGASAAEERARLIAETLAATTRTR